MSNIDRAYPGRLWPGAVRRIVMAGVVVLWIHAFVFAIDVIRPTLVHFAGQIWEDFAPIAMLCLFPVVAATTDWLVERILTFSSARRLGDALMWHEYFGQEWQALRVREMDADMYEAFRRRTLFVAFAASVSLMLGFLLAPLSPWLWLIPLVTAAAGVYWIWFGR